MGKRTKISIEWVSERKPRPLNEAPKLKRNDNREKILLERHKTRKRNVARKLEKGITPRNHQGEKDPSVRSRNAKARKEKEERGKSKA